MLGQDQPPLGGGFIDGNHQYDQIKRRQQIGNDVFFRFFGLQGGNTLLQRHNPHACEGADINLVFSDGIGNRLQQIRFVANHQIRHFPGLKVFNQHFFHGTQGLAACHQQGNVGFAQYLQGFFHPKLSQFSLVIHTGGVNEHYRAQRQQLHGFVHRVRGGSGGIGNDGQLLSGDGVDDAGLARVAVAEKSDMNSLPGGGCV